MTAATELIVCATDFSDEAASALAWAGAFARREGARIDLVHALPEPTRDPELLATDAVRFEAERLHDARARLEQLAESATRAAGVPVHVQILIGDAPERIVHHAGRHAARMIVVGASARSLVERWVLGSVAERTIRSASCPVVIVPRLESGQSWLQGGTDGAARPLRALVGLEGADGAAPLVAFAADLRRRERCDVDFLHLYWPPEEYARLGLRGARNPLEADVDVIMNLEPKLRALIDGLPGQGRVALDLQPALGSPASNLISAADQRPYDLMVVGSHQRHGLARILKGSVAETLAHQATQIPIVCVPIPTAARRGAGAAGMPRLLTVLAPTDLSDIGNAAIPYAYALLRGTGGVVELCHVHEHGLPNPAYAYDLPDQLTAAARATIERELRALVPPEAEAMGITTHVSIVDGGKAAETIVAAAERLNVDAVSLGSHGRSGVARAMLGSVAEAVLRTTKRPVFVVPTRT
jgi:nucleotide-binding universal stress UspA family protein